MFPFLPIGLSLLGASIAGNALADRRVNSARNAVAQAEALRQQRLATPRRWPGLWGLGAEPHGLQTSPVGSYFPELFDYQPLGKVSC